MNIKFLLIFPEAGCEEPVEGDTGHNHGWTKRTPLSPYYCLEFKDAEAFNAAAKDGAMRGTHGKIPVPCILIEETPSEKLFEPNMVAMQAALEKLGKYVGYTSDGEVVIADKAPEVSALPIVPLGDGNQQEKSHETPPPETDALAIIVNPNDVEGLNERIAKGAKIRLGDCAKEGGVSKEYLSAILKEPGCKVIMASGGWLQLKPEEEPKPAEEPAACASATE